MELQRKQMHGMLNKKIQKVSVIILTYNQMDYLYDAIKSVLNQDYPNIELIVSDDASCNFQKGMLEKFIEENKKLRDELNAMVNSKSWKITKPIRDFRTKNKSK
mgnify:CR=1 FL=1